MKFDAVLFDCDGVLVDSEAITCGVLRDMLQEQGWTLSLQECMDIFVGKMVVDERARIEQETGKPFTQEWLASFRQRRNDVLETRIQAVPNIHATVQQLFAATQGRIACASGADRTKIELMLGKVGLLPFFEGRIFSGHEMPRSKPFPDVYLAAAAALGVPPNRCAVVEDTLVGLQAGVAAGAAVFAYVPQGSGQAFLDAGARVVFGDMVELPGLVGA
jgi:HAD superfamily hydrolase (TIGR01509 family)